MDPVCFSSIGQVVFECQAFEVLKPIKSMKFTRQIIDTMLYKCEAMLPKAKEANLDRNTVSVNKST